MTLEAASGPFRPPEAIPGDLIGHWCLDPAIAYLDHGRFGARPEVVTRTQQRWREEFETGPAALLERRRTQLIDEAKSAVGGFLGMGGADFGFVTNATEAVNAVLRSRTWTTGDRLLATSHVYNAVRQTLRWVARRTGAAYDEVEIPLPVRSASELVAAVTGALDDRTRLLVISHISSPTALVFPLKEIIDRCAARNVDVLVDGAHAAGMLDLDIESLGAAYYAGNLHKWVCAPVGAAFLWARPDRQEDLHPATISHFLDGGLAAEFDWQGTRDITPWLSAPAAIDYFTGIGWDKVRRHNHDLAVWVQHLLTGRWQVAPATPLDGSLIGSMVTVEAPPGLRRHDSVQAVERLLHDRYRIEAPVIDFGERWWVRPSCQIYNRPEQYERLAEAVIELAR